MKRILLQFLFGVLIGVMTGEALAQSDHECQGGHNCNKDIMNIVQPSGDKFLALTSSLGAAEIAGCVVTKQWTFIIIGHQYYVYEPWCLAGKLDERGQYENAAMMRCTDKKTAKIYGENCTVVLNFEPSDKPLPSNEQTEYVAKEEYEDRIAALEELFDKQEADSKQQQQVQQQQYRKIQRAEEARQQKIDLIREEFGEQTTTASD